MKKITYLLCTTIFALASLTFTGCGLADTALQAAIDEFNKTCPLDQGSGASITKAVLEENSLVYECSVDVQQTPMEVINASLDNMKQVMTESLKSSYSSDEKTKTLVDLVVTANKSIKYRFSDGTGQTAEVEISNDTLAGF